MFKLVELNIGSFVVVKENANISEMPVNIHGIIQVEEHLNDEYFTNFPYGMSKELLESNEVAALRKEAIDITIENIAD